VQEVLVDGDELAREHLVQHFDDFFVTLHEQRSSRSMTGAVYGPKRRQ
jgi:hypothetical protein